MSAKPFALSALPHSDRCVRTRLLLGTLLTLSAFSAAPAVRAHGDLHGQIQRVAREIAAAPSARLHLQRGELYHDHEDFPAALADFAEAARLDSTLTAVDLARGRTLFKAGRLTEAHAALERYLAVKPAHADAYLLRARIRSGLRRYADAVADFDRNLALSPQASPESFLERAEAWAATGDHAAALAGLDEGLRRLGNLVTLQDAAIAFELALGRTDAALARVDRMLADLPRKESWLARRGEILAATGRTGDAREAFSAALAALERLPAPLRETAAMRDLHARLRLKLGS
ncbi:tetratricopeptide repeat protein [Horticoccus sp. 23ND18S-11]|uniref:tetratricopeptide repeat protein n=1 Tax=Horticoccus sp. 23ND18S-11 TaxID=3391832 RepID=UPI0039C9CCC7